MPSNPPTDAQEISQMLERVNVFGSAAERLFSRLHRGLGRRSKLTEANERANKLADRNRRLQKAVREREQEIERLGSVFASLPDGVIVQDTEGKVILINDSARKLIGNQKNFWQSKLGSLFDEFRSITTMETEIMPVGDPTRVQINNKIIGAQLAAVSDSKGNRLATMIVLRDVTRDALADRLKDEFITGITHELRTPMTVIKGMSEVILGQSADEPPNRRFLETIGRNVDILDRMITELLDISEMSAGSFSIRRDPVDIEELLWGIVTGLTPELKRARLEWRVSIGSMQSQHVSGDQQYLKWAIGHLIQNAIRYNQSGGHVSIRAKLGSNQQIIIQVQDNGVGISERDLPHIFERFYRGEPRTRNGKLLDPRGLGQGLFVARTVCEAHGGYLSVRSESGEGSIFTLVLPSMPAKQPALP